MNRILARLFSLALHPLLLPTYLLALLLWLNPYAFGVPSIWHKRAGVLVLAGFFTTAFLPGLAILLMRPLGFVKSLGMTDKQERTGPYIAAGVFYLWMFKNMLVVGQLPTLYATLMLGATIALFGAFLFNIFGKVSIHTVGGGLLVGALLLVFFQWPQATAKIALTDGTWHITMPALLALGTAMAGLLGTARLSLPAHTPVQVWTGYAIGLGSVALSALCMPIFLL